MSVGTTLTYEYAELMLRQSAESGDASGSMFRFPYSALPLINASVFNMKVDDIPSGLR